MLGMGINLVAAFGKLPLQRVIMATGYVDEYKVFGQPGTRLTPCSSNLLRSKK